MVKPKEIYYICNKLSLGVPKYIKYVTQNKAYYNIF